jgi:hypothetical protein
MQRGTPLTPSKNKQEGITNNWAALSLPLSALASAAAPGILSAGRNGSCRLQKPLCTFAQNDPPLAAFRLDILRGKLENLPMPSSSRMTFLIQTTVEKWKRERRKRHANAKQSGRQKELNANNRLSTVNVRKRPSWHLVAMSPTKRWLTRPI